MKDLSLNLLDIAENSVKAEATLTQLLLTQEGSILTFQVVDDGCGMTEEAQSRIFDKFYQAMVDNNQLGYTQIGGETYFATALDITPEGELLVKRADTGKTEVVFSAEVSIRGEEK